MRHEVVPETTSFWIKPFLEKGLEVIDMPARDGTGPAGEGALTGRGMGPCGAGYRRVPARGLGMGFGRGFRRGFGRGPAMAPGWGYAPAQAYQPTKEQEAADLKAEKETLERELEDIRARLKELESKK